jgi:hypothetical protein
MRRAALASVLGSLVLYGAAAPAEEGGTLPAQERPRDAAEAVQEGSVTQWLEHYQRERGEQWKRAQGAPAETGAPKAERTAPAKLDPRRDP